MNLGSSELILAIEMVARELVIRNEVKGQKKKTPIEKEKTEEEESFQDKLGTFSKEFQWHNSQGSHIVLDPRMIATDKDALDYKDLNNGNVAQNIYIQ